MRNREFFLLLECAMAWRVSKAITIVHLILTGLLVSVAPAASDRRPPLSGTIIAVDDLAPHVARMLERSATFRQQWIRLEAATVFVRIRRNLLLQNRPYQARTIINRVVGGAIVAAVEIGPCGDPTEWLAHELEHILEQVDGVNLERLVRSRRGAWPSSEETFETERAIRVGRAVRREVMENHGLAQAPRSVETSRGDE